MCACTAACGGSSVGGPAGALLAGVGFLSPALVCPNALSALSQKFYRDYYHPSNARFWFYGDDAGGCLADVCWPPLSEPATCPSPVRHAAVLPVHCPATSIWAARQPCLASTRPAMVLANHCSRTHTNNPCCSLQWRSGCACWTLTCLSLRRGPWTRAWRPSRCSRWVVQLEGRQTCLVGSVVAWTAIDGLAADTFLSHICCRCEVCDT